MIITDDKTIAKYLPNSTLINSNELFKYNGSNQIEIVVGSRDLARSCEIIQLPRLKFIQLLSAGYDGVNIERLKKRGIVISNAGDIYSVGMAEFVIYSILMSAKKYNKSIKNQNIRYQRNYKYISELASKTVGIMGTGSIGSAVAKRLSGFDVQILGYDLRSEKKPYFDIIYSIDNVNEFLSRCDFLIVSLPLNDKTNAVIDKAMFNVMKSDVTIINVGRKELFNNEDFLIHLKNNTQMTAILDMFEIFPNPLTNPFRRLSNVKILPGVSAISKEINHKRLKLVANNIELLKNNQIPKYQI